MLFILQIALGVCLGLWLFRFLLSRRISLPRPSVKGAIAFCAFALVGLWLFDLALKAFL